MSTNSTLHHRTPPTRNTCWCDQPHTLTMVKHTIDGWLTLCSKRSITYDMYKDMRAIGWIYHLTTLYWRTTTVIYSHWSICPNHICHHILDTICAYINAQINLGDQRPRSACLCRRYFQLCSGVDNHCPIANIYKHGLLLDSICNHYHRYHSKYWCIFINAYANLTLDNPRGCRILSSTNEWTPPLAKLFRQAAHNDMAPGLQPHPCSHRSPSKRYAEKCDSGTCKWWGRWCSDVDLLNLLDRHFIKSMFG